MFSYFTQIKGGHAKRRRTSITLKTAQLDGIAFLQWARYRQCMITANKVAEARFELSNLNREYRILGLMGPDIAKPTLWPMRIVCIWVGGGGTWVTFHWPVQQLAAANYQHAALVTRLLHRCTVQCCQMSCSALYLWPFAAGCSLAGPVIRLCVRLDRGRLMVRFGFFWHMLLL